LTPVDVNAARIEGGEEVAKSLRENAEFLRNLCNQEGATVLDLHASLSGEAFVWRDEKRVSEHLNNIGRTFVAGEVAAGVRQLLSLPKTESK
jgi:hypothetical protein